MAGKDKYVLSILRSLNERQHEGLAEVIQDLLDDEWLSSTQDGKRLARSIEQD